MTGSSNTRWDVNGVLFEQSCCLRGPRGAEQHTVARESRVVIQLDVSIKYRKTNVFRNILFTNEELKAVLRLRENLISESYTNILQGKDG